ncbi:MAG: hypothetical protein AAGA62_19075, partial [Bacteroidota bacterium]
MSTLRFFPFLVGLLLIHLDRLAAQETIDLDFPRAKIVAALQQRPNLAVPSVQFSLSEKELAKQAYQIEVWGNEISVRGGDERGLLYGGLEVAEQIELYGKVKNTKGKAFLAKRGIKFNIPLDARTPGYDDTGDAAQKNIAEPAFSPDGRYLYFSQDVTSGTVWQYNNDSTGQVFAVRRLDRDSGETVQVAGGPGGAIRPTPSPDGKALAYVKRHP